MNIWQVKAGDGNRDYSKVFLHYGVMLIGPGEDGDYWKNPKKYEGIREFRQFFEDAVKGDLVVLKRPCGGTKWEAIAVGKITSEGFYAPVFSDVEGFSLQHCRQVEWKEPSQVKSVRGLGRSGGTICHLNDERARETAKQIWKEGRRKKSEPIPDEPEELSPKKLTDSLTDEGLPREKARRIADEIDRLQKLATWYYDVGYYDDDVGEHEARTFLVVPLIRSLGWDEKQMRIEWKFKDAVLFDSPYSKKSKPLILIESKRLGHGLGDAPEQAVEYAKEAMQNNADTF